MPNLVGELDWAIRGLDRIGGTSLLEKFGINFRAVVAAGTAGVLPVHDCGDGLFEPQEDGKPAIILPVADEYPISEWPGDASPVYDLVAFIPSLPDKWFLRVGDGIVLGHRNIDKARPSIHGREPLEVFSTPLAWLQNGCRGVVFLQTGPIIRTYVWGLGVQLIADTPELAKTLYDSLNAPFPELPKVCLREERRTA